MVYRFVVPGQPVPAARARATVRGGFAKMYMPTENRKHETLVRAALARDLKGMTPIPPGVPVKMEVVFWFARPKSHFGTGKNAAKLKPSAPVFHTSKPDVDNLMKLLKDGMAKIAWDDDRQVCEYGQIQKRYVDTTVTEPCTAVSFWEMT